VGYIMRNGYT